MFVGEKTKNAWGAALAADLVKPADAAIKGSAPEPAAEGTAALKAGKCPCNGES